MQNDSGSYYADVLAALGAEFQGIQHAPRGALILFRDPHLGSTLAVAQSEFTFEVAMRRLFENRTVPRMLSTDLPMPCPE